MNIAELKQAAQKEFDDLTAEGEQHRQRIEEIEDQKKRLQGKYSAYESLEADPAQTIVAEPAVVPKSKKAKK